MKGRNFLNLTSVCIKWPKEPFLYVKFRSRKNHLALSFHVDEVLRLTVFHTILGDV